MNKIHTISISALVAGLFLFAGCSSTPASTNTNTNESANDNTNNNVNVVLKENKNITTESELNTSDWQTYTNDEYGFSFQYPEEWDVTGNSSRHIRVTIEKLDNLALTREVTPTASVSPELRDQNETEKTNLESNQPSTFGGQLVQTATTNFFQYIGYIEGGSMAIEYVTYLEDKKITIGYLEGDNTEFADALSHVGRSGLIQQYREEVIDNQELKKNFETFQSIIKTFKE